MKLIIWRKLIMNKLLLVPFFVLLSIANAQAAFTPLTDGDYQMLITGGCFTFGDCSAGFNDNVDNTSNAQTRITTSQGTFGSGIIGDGLVGVIDFTLTSGNITVTSFSQDSYIATAGGTFYIEAPDTTGMTGSIDNTGNMTFQPTGRRAIAQFFAESLGVQPWNIANSPTGTADEWTTGSQTNATAALNGSPLQDSGTDQWTGTMVSASTVGPAWGFFVGTPYTEIFNITITSQGPQIPRASVRITPQGGATQECSETGGSSVTYVATIELFNGAELSTVEWLIDGEVVNLGPETSITAFSSLGSHSVEAIATLVTGQTSNDTTTVEVKDTQRPSLTAAFVDARTHTTITEITDNEKHFVEVQLIAEDICDSTPTSSGTITPVFPVQNTDIIGVRGRKGQINFPSTALNLRGSARDASGNSSFEANAMLHIISSFEHDHFANQH